MKAGHSPPFFVRLYMFLENLLRVMYSLCFGFFCWELIYELAVFQINLIYVIVNAKIKKVIFRVCNCC